MTKANLMIERRVAGVALMALAMLLVAPATRAAPIPPPNDLCGSATSIGALPFTDMLDVSEATTSGSDPAQTCGSDSFPTNAGSVWYTVTAAADAVLVAETFGSDYDTVIAAFAGDCAAPLVLACNDDIGAGLQSQIAFAVEAGATYLIEVTAYGDDAPGFLALAVDARTRDSGKANDGCQREIKKRGAQFAAKKLKSLQTCVDGLVKCTQEKSGDAKCRDKAALKCGKQLVKIGREDGKLRETIVKKCAAVEPPDLLDPFGLGYERIAVHCEKAYGTILTDDPATVAQCVARHHGCVAEMLLEMQEPRAGELLRLAGFDIALDLADCLRDFGGDGADVGDPKGAGKKLVKCQRTARKVSARLAAKRLASLEKCFDAIFTCAQRKPGDERCYDKAAVKCEKEQQKMAKETDKVAPAIEKVCSAVDYGLALAPQGSNIGALGPTCQDWDFPSIDDPADYTACGIRQHSCLVEQMLRYQAPRGEELTSRAGADPFDSFCDTWAW